MLRWLQATLVVPVCLLLALPAVAQAVPPVLATQTGQLGAANAPRARTLFGPQSGNSLNQPFASEGLTPGEDYQLGPGDGLSVHLWGGDSDLDYPVTINPQGKIYLPRLGEVRAAGTTPRALEGQLQQLISRRSAATRVMVMLVQPRYIKVFASGQVDSPGVYTIPAETRLSETLRLAGGVAENGSLRQVTVTAVDGSKRSVDLYQFAYAGDLTQNPKLRAGDRILVPMIVRRVAFLGQVVRPGLFELTEGDTVSSLLELAGGANREGALREATVWPGGLRGEPAALRQLNLADPKTAPSVLTDGDIVFIPSQRNPQETSVVYVYGSVSRPGAVPYRAGNRLSDYLNAAGGPAPSAWLQSVRITRAGRNARAEVQTANAYEILYNGRYDEDPLIGANDIVFVPESFFSFRNVGDLSGLSGLFFGGAAIINLFRFR
ncbi:MAG: SLBB domain-containing protein [Candidatus Sericytochromatia bacterium]|nr:SLBB domain-containing protein [Candidatus Sericytochromatia bacterium]